MRCVRNRFLTAPLCAPIHDPPTLTLGRTQPMYPCAGGRRCWTGGAGLQSHPQLLPQSELARCILRASRCAVDADLPLSERAGRAKSSAQCLTPPKTPLGAFAATRFAIDTRKLHGRSPFGPFVRPNPNLERKLGHLLPIQCATRMSHRTQRACTPHRLANSETTAPGRPQRLSHQNEGNACATRRPRAPGDRHLCQNFLDHNAAPCHSASCSPPTPRAAR